MRFSFILSTMNILRHPLVLSGSLILAMMVLALGLSKPTPAPATENALTLNDPSRLHPPAMRQHHQGNVTPNIKQLNPFEYLDLHPAGSPIPDVTFRPVNAPILKTTAMKHVKSAVVIFYQGSFCSVCGHQLSDIQSHLADFKQKGAEIIAISADVPEESRRTVGELGLSFPVVPDPQGQLINAFGVANVVRKSRSGQCNLAFPVVYVLNTQTQTVTAVLAHESGQRAESAEILPLL